MHDYLIDLLQCPVCHGHLSWNEAQRQGDRLEAATATCDSCAAAYPVQEGIGVFLTPDLQRDDLWEQQESWISRYLREHPDVERQLMESPLESLGPADRCFRAQVHDQRGERAEAEAAGEGTRSGIYTAEHIAASDDQIRYVMETLGHTGGPVVDLASGWGTFPDKLARDTQRLSVATDFSPSILRRDRQRWERDGIYDRISLLSFDARRTPFRDWSVDTLVSHVGLPNIRDPGDLLHELRRIVSGEFLTVHHFFPEDDEANAEIIRDHQLEDLLYRRRALDSFAAAGWQVEVASSRHAQASPTPDSVLLDGARIDGMPVADTVMEFCVLRARPAA